MARPATPPPRDADPRSSTTGPLVPPPPVVGRSRKADGDAPPPRGETLIGIPPPPAATERTGPVEDPPAEPAVVARGATQVGLPTPSAAEAGEHVPDPPIGVLDEDSVPLVDAARLFDVDDVAPATFDASAASTDGVAEPVASAGDVSMPPGDVAALLAGLTAPRGEPDVLFRDLPARPEDELAWRPIPSFGTTHVPADDDASAPSLPASAPTAGESRGDATIPALALADTLAPDATLVADERVEPRSTRLPEPAKLRAEAPLGREFREPRRAGSRSSPRRSHDTPPPDAGVPRTVVFGDTDVLIDSVAAELIGPEPVAAPEPSAPVHGDTAPARVQPAVATARVAVAARPRRRGWIVAAIVAIAVVAVIAVAVSWRSSSPPDVPVGPQEVAAAVAEDDPGAPQGEAVPSPAPVEPEVPAAVIDEAPVDEAVLDPVAAALDVPQDAIEVDTDAADPAEAQADAEAGADPDDPASVATRPTPAKPKAGGGSPSHPSSKPTPTTTDDAPDAAALLAEARRAYSAGHAARAYRLAKQSHAASPSEEALETMALASCQRGDKDEAKRLVKSLSLLRRGSVRERCKTHGVRLGL